MPVILAIEPDRRQAAHLTAIVRQRVRAELILADTTEGALNAIGNRIPDMVLVPAFLSPSDDASLAAALRVIAAAAHVRTLTIPVLSSGERRAATGGLLARWRRARAESPASDGCDPAVFAEQITAYLKETDAERADLEMRETVEIASIVEAPMVAIVEPEVLPIAESLPVEFTAPMADTVEPVAMPIAESLPVEFATPMVDTVELVAIPFAATPAPPDEGAIEGAGAIDLSTALAFLSEREEDGSDAADDERFAGERVGVYTIETRAGEPRFIAEDAVVEAAVAEEPERPRADLVPWTEMYLTPGRIWPTLEGVQAEAPPPADERPAEPEPVAATPRPLAWTALVASLRQDIERRRAESVPAVDPPEAARAANVAAIRGSQPDTRQKRRGPNVKPAQDEWGFFDPEQCGFAALLAKLDQITVGSDAADDDVRRPA